MLTGHESELAAQDWDDRVYERAQSGRHGEWRECDCTLRSFNLLAPCTCGAQQLRDLALGGAEGALLAEEARALSERFVAGKISGKQYARESQAIVTYVASRRARLDARSAALVAEWDRAGASADRAGMA